MAAKISTDRSMVSTISEMSSLEELPDLLERLIVHLKEVKKAQERRKESPFYRSTVSLLSTYEKIKHLRKSAEIPPLFFIDPFKHSLIDSPKRYEVIRLIGEGSQACVFLGQDKITDELVAVKVSRVFKDARGKRVDEIAYSMTKNELELLIGDLRGVPHVVQLKEAFDYSDLQLKLIFEYLGEKNVCQRYLEDPSNPGISLFHLRCFSRQLLETLVFLNERDIAYADLKPGNLFYDEEKMQLKILDWGLSFNCKTGRSRIIVQSIYYRAPEVFLRGKFGCEIDIWSLGCVLFELYTNKTLFKVPHAEENEETYNDYLTLFASALGPPPEDFAKKGRDFSRYFTDKTITGQLEFRHICSQELMEYLERHPRKKIEESILEAATIRMDVLGEAKLLTDLISQMIKYEGRITPSEALYHPFFRF